MSNRNVLAAVGVMLAMTGASQVLPSAQQKPTVRLTPQDYTEIQELLARYNSTLNVGDAEGFASIFLPDGSLNIPNNEGVMVRTTGYDALVEFVRPKPLDQVRFTPNLIVRSTPEGATASSDQFAWRIDKGAVTFIGGFDDVLVKTREGWRFKTRTIHRGPAKPAS